jgi:hypothetical protein
LAAKREAYVPTRTNRFYPGRASRDRLGDLSNLPADEISVEAVLLTGSRALRGRLYALARAIAETLGEEAEAAVIREYGSLLGRREYGRFLETQGVRSGSPELMAMFQDLAAAYLGPQFADTTTSYTESECLVRKESCPFHDPAAPRSLCPLVEEAMAAGHVETDPALAASEKPLCLSRGDPRCERVYRFESVGGR